MKGIEKFLVAFLILLLASAAVFGEGKGEAPAAASKAPVKITVELLDFGNIPPGEGTWADNRWTKFARQEALKFGVDVEYFVVPRTEEVSKLNALLSSNSAPDLVHTYDRTTFLNYVSMGGVTELDKHVAENGPNITKWFGESQLQYGRVGGKLYAIPARRASHAQFGSFIRKDFLDKAGLAMPSTVEDFYSVLKTLKENPGKVGATAIVPIGVSTNANDSLEEIILAFCKTPTAEEITTAPLFLLPGYVDGLKFVNRLYHEGFFNKDFALDQNASKVKESYANNQLVYVKSHSSYPWMDLNHIALQQKVPDARVVMFGGLKNKSGEFSNITAKAAVSVGFYNFVPRTAKNPGAVVEYLDWLVGDGGDVLWWGFENEHYVIKDGIKVPKDPAYNDRTLNWMRAWIVPVYNMTAGRDPQMQKKLLETRFGGQNGKDYREGMELLEKRYTPGTLLDSVVKSAGKYSSALDRLLVDGVNRIVSGPADQVEAAYKKLVDEYMAAGGKEVFDESKAAYAKMNR